MRQLYKLASRSSMRDNPAEHVVYVNGHADTGHALGCNKLFECNSNSMTLMKRTAIVISEAFYFVPFDCLDMHIKKGLHASCNSVQLNTDICFLQDLADKIASLNAAIDDVSSQLKSQDKVEETSVA